MTTTQRTPLEGLAWAIEQFEGGFQNDPDDSGNWVYLNDGTRKLIGTNHGVTPAALAHYTGQDPATVTVAQICNVTAEFAAKIGFEKYFLRKVRTGVSEPFYEKLALQALGLGKLKDIKISEPAE